MFYANVSVLTLIHTSKYEYKLMFLIVSKFHFSQNLGGLYLSTIGIIRKFLQDALVVCIVHSYIYFCALLHLINLTTAVEHEFIFKSKTFKFSGTCNIGLLLLDPQSSLQQIA